MEMKLSRNSSETEDDESVESQNAGLVDVENLTKMKRHVLEFLGKDKDQSFMAWETVAERICAFAGQVSEDLGNLK